MMLQADNTAAKKEPSVTNAGFFSKAADAMRRLLKNATTPYVPTKFSTLVVDGKPGLPGNHPGNRNK